MISNVPEGFDDVDKLSYEQTSGSWLRLTAEDVSTKKPLVPRGIQLGNPNR